MAPPAGCLKCRRDQQGCCFKRPRRRTSTRPRRAPKGVDRLSALPDDLLLEVLARLRCARAAAHTSLLARRWRGLCANLPQLTFHAACPDTLDAALAMSAHPSLSLLHISVPFHHGPFQSARISSWMRAAARLAPAELVIKNVIIRRDIGFGWEVQLPTFHRATSIALEVFGAHFVLPPAGDLPALESLFLESCHVDLGDLLPRCPHLRKLQITGWDHELLKVHSPSLEELDVDVRFQGLMIRHVDIVAPVLKKLRFASGSRPWRWSGAKEFTLSYSAPMVEDLNWRCAYGSDTDRFGVRWCLFNLTLKTANPLAQMHLQRQQRPHVVHSLSMSIGQRFSVSEDEDKYFGQQISKIIPVTNFQVLKLRIETKGHVYGAMMLHLLGMCSFIRRLRLKLYQEACTCREKCPCDHPSNWRNQNVSLTDLKEIEIHGFKGKRHEVDLLKVLFRSATMLERTDIYFANMVSPSNNGLEEIYAIANAYPSIKCNIYQVSAECVSYA
ncbi:hypothetical protein EJB05_12631, partial [Eragrostis curvula]